MPTQIQVKRNSVSGVRPTTSNIQPGELAINIQDGILFSANATTVFEVGANLTAFAVGNSTSRVTANTTVLFVSNSIALRANGSNGSSGQVLTSNGTGIYWSTVTGGAGVNTAAQYTWTNVQTFSANVVFSAGISANGGFGTSGQVLASNGTGIYWTSASAASSVRQSFTANSTVNTTFTVTGGYVPNQIDVYRNGVKLVNGSDVTVTSGTSVVLATPAANGDSIDVVASSATAFAVNTSAQYTWANLNTFSANATFSDQINVASKIQIGTPGAFDFGPLAEIEIDANANSYIQVVIQNANTGNNSSSDLVVTNDTGNDSVNFIDLGINGSGYTQAAFNIGGPNDGYLYASNGALTIGTASAREIVFHANGMTSADRKFTVNSAAVTIANSVALVANGSNGTSGQVLTSNGTGVTWTSIQSTAYTFSVLETFQANLHTGNSTVNAQLSNAVITINNSNTAVLNASSIGFGNATVNSTYGLARITINGATIANATGANNAFNLGGVAAASYVNTSGAYTITGLRTMQANLHTGNSTVNTQVSNSVITINNSNTITINSTSIAMGNTTVNAQFTAASATVNAITIRANTGFTLGTSSSAANGYSFMPNGLVMVWGTVSSNATAGDITFARAFTTLYNVQVAINATTYNSTYAPMLIAANTTTANVRTGNATSRNVYFMAIGV